MVPRTEAGDSHREQPQEKAAVRTIAVWWASMARSHLRLVRSQATFKEYPPRQRAATFGIDQAIDTMKQNLGGN